MGNFAFTVNTIASAGVDQGVWCSHASARRALSRVVQLARRAVLRPSCLPSPCLRLCQNEPILAGNEAILRPIWVRFLRSNPPCILCHDFITKYLRIFNLASFRKKHLSRSPPPTLPRIPFGASRPLRFFLPKRMSNNYRPYTTATPPRPAQISFFNNRNLRFVGQAARLPSPPRLS
jgi:hypothetical protein